MRKKLLLMVLPCCMFFSLFAQMTFKSRVVDKDQEPVSCTEIFPKKIIVGVVTNDKPFGSRYAITLFRSDRDCLYQNKNKGLC